MASTRRHQKESADAGLVRNATISPVTKKRTRTTQQELRVSKKQKTTAEDAERAIKRKHESIEDQLETKSVTETALAPMGASNQRSKHVRFGSEEADSAGNGFAKDVPIVSANVPELEIESDEEAPEDISATTASREAKQASVAAGEAINQYVIR